MIILPYMNSTFFQSLLFPLERFTHCRLFLKYHTYTGFCCNFFSLIQPLKRHDGVMQRKHLNEDTARCFCKASFRAVTQAASITPLGPPHTHKHTISEHTPHPHTAITARTELHQLREDRFQIKSPTETRGSPAPPVLFLLIESRLRGGESRAGQY